MNLFFASGVFMFRANILMQSGSSLDSALL